MSFIKNLYAWLVIEFRCFFGIGFNNQIQEGSLALRAEKNLDGSILAWIDYWSIDSGSSVLHRTVMNQKEYDTMMITLEQNLDITLEEYLGNFPIIKKTMI